MPRAALRVVTVGVVLAVVGGGLLAWRLWRAPIPLDIVVPRLEAALSDGVIVRIGSAELAWDHVRHRPELRAREVRVGEAGDGSTLALAAVSLRLQIRALLHGRLVVTAVELLEPRLELVRARDGEIELGTPSSGATTGGQGGPDLDRVHEALGHLRSVAIRGGDVTLVDEASGARWRFPRTDGTLRREEERVHLRLEVEAVCGTARVPLMVEGSYDEHAQRFEGQVTARAIATDAALRCWPTDIAADTRGWVAANITGGTVREPRVTFGGRAGDGGGLDTFTGTLAYDGLTVRYVDTMSPAIAVSGTASFSLAGATFAVASGTISALAVKPANVRLGWEGARPPRLEIDARVAGPLASALEVLDAEPIGLAGAIGIQTRGVAGRVTGHVSLDFRLGGNKTTRTVGLSASAAIRGATIPQMPVGWAMTAGDLDVKIDGRGASVTGRARLRDVPVDLRIAERWGDPSSRRVEISTRIDRAGRVALDLDAGAAVDGPIDAIAQLAHGADGRDVADVELDLRAATLDLPLIALRKPAGDPGRLTTRLVLVRGVVSAVERLELTVGGTSVRGSASRPPAGGVWSTVDARVTLAPPSSGAAPGEAVLALRAQGTAWKATLTSRNVGNLTASFGNMRVRGGTLSFEGTMDPFAAGFPLDGRLLVENVTVVDLPWLVRVVTLTSLRGLMGATSDRSIVFDRVTALLSHRAPTIVMKEGSARGSQLGLTGTGTVDLAADTLDLAGTLVPSYYWLNEAPGRVPVIGSVLSLATGGAIQAVNFTVRGPRENPKVAVQPISSLAPGALRDLLRKLGL
ncbi:MAG: AsmA-like C-terminal region-containing protein [Candidatus Binatia bacterium]